MKNVILIFLSICFFCGCDKKEISISETLEYLTSQRSNNIIFNMEEVTDFEWDNLMIVLPYSSVNKLEKKIGIDMKAIKNSGIELNDGIKVLCFFKSNQLIHYVIQPRFPYDFEGVQDSEFIENEKSTFKIIKKKDGFLVRYTPASASM